MSGRTPPETYQFLKDKTRYSVSRIGALYKDFTDVKLLNLEGYEANLVSWLNIFNLLLDYDYSDGSKLSIPFKKPDLATILTLPTIGKPLSLKLVIDELVERRNLIPVSTFIEYDSNIDTYINPSSSIFKYVSPSHWVLVVSGIGSDFLKVFTGNSERYIVWDILTKFTKEFKTQISKELKDGIYSSKIFDERILLQFIHDNITLHFSMLDLQILLKYLSRDLNFCSITTNEEDLSIVKFVPNVEVTTEDIAIAHINWNIAQICKRMVHIEEKIDGIKQRIDKYPTDKIKSDETTKSTVINLLTQRRHQLKVYKQCASNYTQLTEILSKIDDAASNLKITEALQLSAKTLNQLNSKVELAEIDKIHNDIKEGIETTDQITEALGDIDKVDDTEIEKEFQELVKEHQEQDKESENLLKKLEGLNVSDQAIVDNEKDADNTVKKEEEAIAS